MNNSGYMLVSDALYLEANMELQIILPGLCHDQQGYLETIDKIKEYSKKYNAIVVYGHDMEQYKGLIVKAQPYLD